MARPARASATSRGSRSSSWKAPSNGAHSGLGPVIVFPTASHSEMGDGKYQVGPALGYVNKAVKGWQFALLLQQYFSVAGAPGSRVNQLTWLPAAV